MFSGKGSKRNVVFDEMVSLETDGAKVMSGEGKGVYGFLKLLNPFSLWIHCIAHRLALCTSQAAQSMDYLNSFQEWMTSLFYYFKASPTKEKELHKIQEVLNHPVLKVKEIHSVRWLSFYEALEAIFRSIEPLYAYPENRQANYMLSRNMILFLILILSFLF